MNICNKHTLAQICNLEVQLVSSQAEQQINIASSRQRFSRLSHLKILFQSNSFVGTRRRDPDVTVVAEDDVCAETETVDVRLSFLD